MRIIIFSHPRSCSTYFQSLVSRKLNLQDWGEMVGPKVPHTLTHTDLYTFDNYVTKLLSFHLLGNHFQIKLEDIQWSIIDEVFITERYNVTDQLCSMMYKWSSHTNKNYIDVKSNEFIALIKGLDIFYSAKQFLLQNTNAKIVSYEMFQKTPEEYINELNSITNYNFTIEDCKVIKNTKDYSKLIENYDEVKKIVESYLACSVGGLRESNSVV